jgi:hypothetical protein
MSHCLRLVSVSVLAIGTLALGACGGSDTVEAENESVESVAARVAGSDARPRPGRWETKMNIVEVNMPGLTSGMRDMMKQQLGGQKPFVSCLTKEEAEKSEREIFEPPNVQECKYNSFSMGAGRLAADMTCKDESGTRSMQMAGTYGSEAYAMQLTSEGDMGGQKMSMAMEVESRRVGDCDGSEQG